MTLQTPVCAFLGAVGVCRKTKKMLAIVEDEVVQDWIKVHVVDIHRICHLCNGLHTLQQNSFESRNMSKRALEI